MPSAQLLQLFTEDLDTTQRLIDLLEQEHQALEARNLEELSRILGDKHPLLDTLNQHGNLRSQLLRQAGLSPDQNGLQALASRSPDGAALLQQSQALEERLEHCRQLNLRNGRLIHANHTSTTKVLSILRGADSETPGLYNAKGSTVRSGYQRPLSQA